MSAHAGFASFWHGPLNPFAWACLSSFPRAGARLTLYSYDTALEVPEGVLLEDARKICPDETLVHRFPVAGKPSIATFSDMFRYTMIHKTGACWVDADILCVQRPAFGEEPYVFCRQADFVSTLLVNNAVLRLPRDAPALAELVATANAAVDHEQAWGALGPFLLTPVLKKHGLYGRALDPHTCYPVEPELFWTFFVPDCRDTVARQVTGATMVHLWSEAIRWSGYDLGACPPEGSWLHDLFTALGALPRFRRIAPEGEIRSVMAEAIRNSGARVTPASRS
ncbi:MAG: hypothetical protein JOZ27_05945 [Caulobacteraceae bacterium]|nr:hypothetical protein [Caulobacteraceae bacterium]